MAIQPVMQQGPCETAARLRHWLSFIDIDPIVMPIFMAKMKEAEAL
jgi:hypothetical protein